MLENLRRHSRSTLIYVLFAILIAVFVLTFNSASRVTNVGGNVEVLAEIAGTPIDTRELQLAMNLSPDPPPPGAAGFEKMQAQNRYERTRMPYSGTLPELAVLTPWEGAPPAIKSEKLLHELTESILVAADAQKHGLGVSDEELARRVRRLERSFGEKLTDDSGAFDPRKYDVFARFKLGASKASLEAFLRREILRDKMAQVVTSGILLAPTELAALVQAESARPVLEFVTVDADTAAGLVDVTDPDADAWAAANPDKVKAAYEAKAADYQVPERWNVRALLVAAPPKETDPSKEALSKEVEAQWAQKRTAADALRKELDGAWNGEVALDPVLPPGEEGPGEEGKQAPAVAEEDRKKATELAGDEKIARLLQHFSKVASEKSEHMITKDQGGKFAEDKTAEALSRSPFSPAVAAAVAGAEPGTLVGPIEGAQGWWLVVVEKRLAGKTTPLADVQRELARTELQRERAAGELDKVAEAVRLAAAATPTTALADVVKKWNLGRTGKDDGPLSASESGALGKSPLQAMQGGIEAMLGLPPPDDSPDNIPAMGKLPEVAKAAWALRAAAPVAGQVFKSEDGKARYVVRLKAHKPDAAADAKLQDSVGRAVTQLRRQAAWRAYVRKLVADAEVAGQIEKTDAWTTALQLERDRVATLLKRLPAAAENPPGGALGGALGDLSGSAPGGMQLNVGGKPVQLLPSPTPAPTPAKP